MDNIFSAALAAVVGTGVAGVIALVPFIIGELISHTERA